MGTPNVMSLCDKLLCEGTKKYCYWNPPCFHVALLLNVVSNWIKRMSLSRPKMCTHTQINWGSKDTRLNAADASISFASSGPGNREALSLPNTHREYMGVGGERKSERKWEREKHILSPFVLDVRRQISRKANHREDLVKALALKRQKEKKALKRETCQD